MGNASEQAAEKACANLRKIIEAAENSNQAGENAAVMADAAPALYRSLHALLGPSLLGAMGNEELIAEFGMLGLHHIEDARAALAKVQP